MSGPFILAFGIWMLLTADFSWLNTGLGLLAAAMVSFLPRYRFSALQLFQLVLNTLVRFPLAIWETLLLVVLPHKHERINRVRLRQPENPWAIFCETFIITFTPRTLVVSEEDEGDLEQHILERKEMS